MQLIEPCCYFFKLLFKKVETGTKKGHAKKRYRKKKQYTYITQTWEHIALVGQTELRMNVERDRQATKYWHI